LVEEEDAWQADWGIRWRGDEESGQHIVAHECMMETTQVERQAVGGGIRHLQSSVDTADE